MALCAGCNVYPAWAAVIIGALSGPLYLSFNWILLRCQVSFFFKMNAECNLYVLPFRCIVEIKYQICTSSLAAILEVMLVSYVTK